MNDTVHYHITIDSLIGQSYVYISSDPDIARKKWNELFGYMSLLTRCDNPKLTIESGRETARFDECNTMTWKSCKEDCLLVNSGHMDLFAVAGFRMVEISYKVQKLQKYVEKLVKERIYILGSGMILGAILMYVILGGG